MVSHLHAQIYPFCTEVKEECNVLCMAAFISMGSATTIAKYVKAQLYQHMYTFLSAPRVSYNNPSEFELMLVRVLGTMVSSCAPSHTRTTISFQLSMNFTSLPVDNLYPLLLVSRICSQHTREVMVLLAMRSQFQRLHWWQPQWGQCEIVEAVASLSALANEYEVAGSLAKFGEHSKRVEQSFRVRHRGWQTKDSKLSQVVRVKQRAFTFWE
jgi:hypothetical protein